MNRDLARLKILQIAVDGILVFAAFTLSYFLRVGLLFSTDFPFGQYIFIAAITTPITLVFMFFARAYKIAQQVHTLRHLQRIAFVALENVAMFMVLYYFTYKDFFSRLVLVYIFLLTFLFVTLWHRTFRWILKRCWDREIGVFRALVIGANRPGEAIVTRLIETKSHLKPVAIIDASGTGKKSIAGVPVVGKMDVFEKTVAQYRIDHIVQTDHLEQSLNLVNFSLQHNLNYIMPPELLGIFQGHQTLEEIEGQPFLKAHAKKEWWENIW
jgi:FlaA1/EpsC-like NDP-sugar epimerase